MIKEKLIAIKETKEDNAYYNENCSLKIDIEYKMYVSLKLDKIGNNL